MPVEFLSDQEAAAFGRYGGSVPLADLERFFCLDDADRKLVAGQREDHNRHGFSVQLAIGPNRAHGALLLYHQIANR